MRSTHVRLPLAVNSKSEQKVNSLPPLGFKPVIFGMLAHLSNHSASPLFTGLSIMRAVCMFQVKTAYISFLNHCYVDTEVEMKEIYTSKHMWTLFENFLVDMGMVFSHPFIHFTACVDLSVE
jgi:hypothetical protein